MLWFEKIKEDARKIFKKHPASIIACFIGFFLLGVIDDVLSSRTGKKAAKEILTFISDVSFSMAPALALCEANFNYKKKIGKIESLKEIKKSFVYVIVLVIGAVMSIWFAVLKADPESHLYSVFDFDEIGNNDLFMRFFMVYLAVCIVSAVFFLYKKSHETFESYMVKGFLGTMKGELAYGVVLLGGLCIIWVFDTLIHDIDAIALMVATVSGIMAYPAVLIALSRTEEKVSKFGNIMMGYVFPGILAVAFLIIYVYIFKIVFTWKFPSNEAFAIVTALFGTGIFFWTMAQGCTEGSYNLAMRIMPLAFIPFIGIQIICLYMRVAQYGLTQSRYFGVLLIIFEILYEIIYIVRFCLKKGMEWILFPMVLVFVVTALIIPGINVCASVTRSQGRVVEQYIQKAVSGKELSSTELATARSAYSVLDYDAGYEGARFLEKLAKKYPEFDAEDKLGYKSPTVVTDSRTEYYHATNKISTLDTLGFAHVGIVDVSEYGEVPNITNIPLYNGTGNDEFARVDLSALILEMEELKKDDAMQVEYDELLAKHVVLPDGSSLHITYLSFEVLEGTVSDLNINGYYLYN